LKKRPSVQSDKTPLRNIAGSTRSNELVAVIGSGVSLALTDGKYDSLSWRGLIRDGLSYAVRKGKITKQQSEVWNTQVDSSDMDELLLAAEFMSRKLEAPNGDLYARWLRNVFEQVTATNRKMTEAINSIARAGVPLCTLNYDFLLEQVTGLPTVRIGEAIQVNDWMLRRRPGILHLHGSWDAPQSVVLGVRDYESTLGNEVRDLIQRSLGSFKRLLFIGCGDTFSDPNFRALVVWLRKNMRGATPQHYALVGSKDASKRHTDPHWEGFVEPVSYGADYRVLADFISRLFTIKSNPGVKTRGKTVALPNRDKEHERLLRVYKTFLLKDCGEMTLEGVRADMDMAQRKFNLERLFVPLCVTRSLSQSAASEPKREALEHRSRGEATGATVPFGKVFARHRRLALLALPGGGKSLLLKRLAVAYSDATRRELCADGVPAIDVVPVLIRCREWREHIRLPILTMLKKMADITGQSELVNFSEALMPRLKRGAVLLLIDGLDEIHIDADRATFVDHVEAFLAQFKQIRLVVTSREAGFSLVAPGLARFCHRYSIAPLETEAIRALCGHWHKLIVGDTPESVIEAQELALQIERSTALSRLADNPLLLTMILVVKHGNGRLPPDRVTLYGRAVEVLLDTWNIKGHAALNLKEAVPQLAYIAFELTKGGKQTATRNELLGILEEARAKVPQIRLYAQDSPDEFLKRVELRSSLLVEGGHQSEGGRAVPFYQFRHLTFQEYLTAVAVVDGHYVGYQPADTLSTPMRPYLTSANWKEVVPMAAVLAGKRAEPLLALLVLEAQLARDAPRDNPEEDPYFLESPDAVDRLFHCLLEESQAAPETISAALQLIALFARYTDKDALITLARGPYRKELLQQVANVYRTMKWRTRVDTTYAALAGAREPNSYWLSTEGHRELERQITSLDDEEIILGLMTVIGVWWINDDPEEFVSMVPLFLMAERHLRSRNAAVVCIATWVFGIAYMPYRAHVDRPSSDTLDCLLDLWLREYPHSVHSNTAIALNAMAGLPRNSWRPSLTTEQIERVIALDDVARDPGGADSGSATVVAYHSRVVWSDDEVARRLAEMMETSSEVNARLIAQSLRELGAAGRRHLRKKEKGVKRAMTPEV
jgi:hypothetical protein